MTGSGNVSAVGAGLQPVVARGSGQRKEHTVFGLLYR